MNISFIWLVKTLSRKVKHTLWSDWVAGRFVVVSVGLIQPGEERHYSDSQYLKRLHESWRGPFCKGL